MQAPSLDRTLKFSLHKTWQWTWKSDAGSYVIVVLVSIFSDGSFSFHARQDKTRHCAPQKLVKGMGNARTDC